ncbi:hypothetical protein GALMADRAFT_64592 [Galerina marginata CBS 339.88]|uniref:MYND-type domain-containing protein n=1 Tax=Galerina marginata (strain CBS 339.88) TaxID=685588 RepID=A0A067TFR7_GALM3|nr:hypothetical protein GALMADRAFT_64592 [Galerina marginata CBS 339.88]
MADFSGLKKQRKSKESKSYAVSQSNPAGGSSPPNRYEKDSGRMPVDSEGPFHKVEPTVKSVPTPLHVNDLHTALPPSLEIRMSTDEAGNGRGIYSKYYRKPGEVLLSVKPHVAALSNEHLEEYCSNCVSPKSATGSLRRCTGCKLLHYCDAKCQTADWLFHRNECIAIQRWSTSSSSEGSGSAPIPGDAIRCLGRILWRKQKLGQESVWSREMDGLQSHRTSINKDPNSRDSQTYTQLAHAIVRFLGLNSPQELSEYGMHNAAELVDLVSRFTTNTFTISTPALAPLGACVSPLVALINHSCDPNAVVVFPRAGSREQEPLMQVIALKPISPDEEVLTAYIDTTLPREKRQQILQETYHFTCKCNLCAPSPTSPPDLREAMWCPKKCGGVCALPTEENSLTRCSRCKTPVKDTDAVLDAIRVGEEALHKAEALQFSNPPKAIQLTTNLIPILVSAGVVPAAYPLLALARLNATLLIAYLPSPDSSIEEVLSPEIQASHSGLGTTQHKITPKEAQESLNDVIRAATRASTGLAQILTEGHPVRGIALAELGKLLTVDEPHPTHLQEPNAQPQSPLMINPNLKAPPPYPPSGPARLKMAYETLVRARAELMVGFGGGKNEGGEVGRQVRQLAAEVEKELMVWKSGVRMALEDRPKAVLGSGK